MFLGVKSHRDALGVESYADAQRALERASLTPTGKRRREKPEGFHLGMNRNRGVTWVKQYGEGGPIAFTLYNTDVVTWHPDGSVSIENYGTVTTSGFASRFLPAGFHLRHPVERRGACGGDRGIVYSPPGARGWEDKRICFGRVVTFHSDGDGWAPDEATLAKVVFPVLDRTGARKLAKKLNLAAFENWLSMAPVHLDIEHAEFDIAECARALAKRDFQQAAMHLPLICETSSWGGHNLKPLPIATGSSRAHITMGSIGKLKLALWEDHGLLKDEILTTIGRGEFDRRMARVRELNTLGFRGTYGPQ